MKAGKLRHLLRLERPRVVGEETGGFKPDPEGPPSGWDFAGEVRAEVTDVTARERFQVGQLDSGITTTVKTRYNEKIDATCRFRFGDRVLYVKGPAIKDARLREMTLTCEERTV